MFTLLLVRTAIVVVDAHFIKSEGNPICDVLSRGVSAVEAVNTELLSSGVGTVEHYLPHILADCSPQLDTKSDEAFEGL